MPLQKSFSDQNHSHRRPRHHWQRHHSDHGPHRATTTAGAAVHTPTTVSAATRQKLNSFHFETDTEKARRLDGEKSTAVEPACLDAAQSLVRALPQDSSVPAREFPTTPAGKLALPDLLRMVEVERSVEKISPEERLLWNHDKRMLNTPSGCGALKRKRTRARSSSPTETPRRIARRRGSDTVFDLDQLTQLLKTPRGDHAIELWDRNAFSTSAITPQQKPIPALAHVMYTSSPQAKEGSAHRFPRSLGRAASCGKEWPKRRRLDPDTERGDDVFTKPTRSKHAMINSLLEKVQEGMVDSEARPSEPLSSSPLPQKRGRLDADFSSSPLAPPKDAHQETDKSEPRLPKPRKDGDFAKPSLSGSSDYGDFSEGDIDMTALQPAKPPPLLQSSDTISNGTVDVREFAETRCEKAPVKDEFDDSDDDFAADLVEFAATLDSQPQSHADQSLSSKPTASTKVKSEKLVPAESDDEFGDELLLDEADFEEAEILASQRVQPRDTLSCAPKPDPCEQLPQKLRVIQRYRVTKVILSQYETTQGAFRSEKLLIVVVENTNITRTVHLRDGWVDTKAHEKAFVHIIGTFEDGQCIINDLHGMIILHPDHLVSSTVVADSFGCMRRAVLQDRVKATSEPSQPLVYGTILHEIFQAALLCNRWDTKWLTEMIETIATRHLEDLYMIRVQIPQAVAYLSSKMGEVQAWAELFVTSSPKPEAKVRSTRGEVATVAVTKLLDVEEHVWSPMYGLKGNIDATVQITVQDGKTTRLLTAPFEVKTGRNPSIAHRAQTALYNLLLSDRYDIEIAYGILYYMETSETIRIPAIRLEIRQMIMQRNELAGYIRERDTQLPPMLRQDNMCQRCYAKTSCFIYHKLADDGDGETSGMTAKFDEVVKHLRPNHKEFFLKWETLLTKEEKESLKFRRELWTMQSSEREKLGRCFASVVVEPGSAYEDKESPKINRFRYTLVKEKPAPGFSFLDSQIIVGEPIVISDEQGHYALANGYATNVRKDRITVEVDRRLHNARIRQPGFHETNNQTFGGIMEVASEGCTPEEMSGKIVDKPVVYRLDKDEFSNGMATVRNNLIQVMADGPFGSRKTRRLVVDLHAPTFKTQATLHGLNDDSLNVDQKQAVEKVMSAKDYALVLGMPGTGKTTTIAHIIRSLVSMGKSVMLTSYTHTAVDNILLKLQHDSIPILRLGALSKISPEVQKFAIPAVTPKKDQEELRASWHNTPIVATTCLGINHPIFNERTFDYCIVDEASQITLPVCLGPIRMAETFILVGDHNQLPPLVQNEDARAGGLDISLFKLLSDAHPSSVVNLEHQYRMCEDVMTLSNQLIYSGRLKCGTPEVAARSISIPHMERLAVHHHSSSTISRTQRSVCAGSARQSCWLRDLLDPATKVSFINTDALLPESREEAKGSRIVNPTEAAICMQLVEGLLSVGVPADDIGVMTHYRSQLALIKHGLRGHGNIEMHTADRFQGRDKEVVILSLVRSNEAKSIGDLLKDWRRINVAFTRAKTKLLVIGSKETLQGHGDVPDHGSNEDMVARFVTLMAAKGWIYDLPRGALEDHVFDVAATQASNLGSSMASSQWKKVTETRKPLNDKENTTALSGRRTAKVGERAIMAGRPVLRDIINDMTGR